MQINCDVTPEGDKIQLNLTVTLTVSPVDVAIATTRVLSDYNDPISGDSPPEAGHVCAAVPEEVITRKLDQFFDEFYQSDYPKKYRRNPTLLALTNQIVTEALTGQYLYHLTPKFLYVTPALLKYFPERDFIELPNRFYRSAIEPGSDHFHLRHKLEWFPAEKCGIDWNEQLYRDAWGIYQRAMNTGEYDGVVAHLKQIQSEMTPESSCHTSTHLLIEGVLKKQVPVM